MLRIDLAGRVVLTAAFLVATQAEVAQRAADGTIKAVWSGKATVLLDAPKARVVPMNFHLPPGTNSDFQKFAVGRAAPHWLGLMLWTEPGNPLNSVGIAPRDLDRRWSLHFEVSSSV